jgi:hypothetical protein
MARPDTRRDGPPTPKMSAMNDMTDHYWRFNETTCGIEYLYNNIINTFLVKRTSARSSTFAACDPNGRWVKWDVKKLSSTINGGTAKGGADWTDSKLKPISAITGTHLFCLLNSIRFCYVELIYFVY